jgi:lipopolysaccharide/colanic/teichoic acid biosynthesis glycosyltransferase/dTDP-glucose pyrophosphorylase
MRPISQRPRQGHIGGMEGGGLVDRSAKRLLDMVLAATFLVLLLPVLVGLAFAIKLDSRGPVFFRCRRIGFRGREFGMLKFRKMYDGASGPALTVSGDERLTRLGRFLAASKLDELPQLWNVLRGEMSLVGPRPEDPQFVALRRDEYDRILAVRPGITGLAQLAFAREGTILDPGDRVGDYVDRLLPQKIGIDTMYASRRSLALDLRILLWTAIAVLLRRDVAVHRETGRLTHRKRPSVERLPAPTHRREVLLTREAYDKAVSFQSANGSHANGANGANGSYANGANGNGANGNGAVLANGHHANGHVANGNGAVLANGHHANGHVANGNGAVLANGHHANGHVANGHQANGHKNGFARELLGGARSPRANGKRGGPTRAVVLAGGRGTRLAPYTSVLPKPLMPIGDRAILEVVVAQLAGHGFSEITFCVGHLSHLIRAVFDHSRSADAEISYVHEEEALGTAGPLRLVGDLQETFLVMNGDVLTHLDYRDLVRHHVACGNVLTIATHKRIVKVDYGVLQLRAEGDTARVQAYVEKPEIVSTVSMGIYVLEPSALEFIPKEARFDIPELVQALLQADRRIGAYEYEGLWFDIGRQDDYYEAVTAWTASAETVAHPEGVPVVMERPHGSVRVFR